MPISTELAVRAAMSRDVDAAADLLAAAFAVRGEGNVDGTRLWCLFRPAAR